MLSLLRLERKQNNYSNPFPILIFFFFSYSFGIETINTFIHSVIHSKTIPDSRPKWAKFIPVFRPKRRKNPTRWGGTYLYSLYKGLPPVSQRFGHPRVLGIPIPISLAFWASPSHITAAFWASPGTLPRCPNP